MPFNDNGMQVMAHAIGAVAVKMHLHGDNPGVNGTGNRTSADAQTFSWTDPISDGDFNLSAPVKFTGMSPGDPCEWVSLWNTAETVTYGNFEMMGTKVANSLGEYTVGQLIINGSSS